MLTIAGSGINLYSLAEVIEKVQCSEFDCLITDINFDTPENKELLPANLEVNFLPFKEIRLFIKEKYLQNKKILYVVTGSPIFYSATKEILRYLENEIPEFDSNRVNVLPAESSKDYILRKLNIPESEVTALSLHGRDFLDLTKFLTTKYAFLLCDEHSLQKIADDTRFIQDDLIFYIGSKLGSDDERITKFDLYKATKEMSLEEIKQALVPYVLLIERKYDISQTFSNNEDFETNAGMLTKTDKRAITLQSLELQPNLLMWDIGAGSGSVSIDAYKIFKIRSLLFEKNEEQCAFIKRNLTNHKVAGTQLFEGNVLENYKKAPKPDRIFIGGGGEKVLNQVENLYLELKDNGLMVINVVVLENLSELLLTLRKADIDYEVRSIDISNYKKISQDIKLSIAESERTLFQVIVKK
ncbi:MAG: precorrin-6Y C5,15-methyltransferase (decarboxylating) subunit CbiT [Candidatus Melainabacteria bacterium RIFOXYA2_FULL_32_9]|nr:MAG: precorrin-6Y C5,15-methyltransferase (decarboxylating) subunit CbiT [Candidatus Melainabacteria bacterium RIFOXYA2_FULL_32_9]